MRILVALITFMAITAAACGGAASTTADPAAGGQSSAVPQGDASPGGGRSAGTEPEAGGIETEPPGPVEPNTIRIGSQVWKRTLPMTTGQCFLAKADGTLPTWGVAWGTLDGNDDLHFSATLDQDGTFSADVNDNTRNPTTPLPHWYAGARSPGIQDLVVELDFDTLTIRGQGTFAAVGTGKLASGSFEFICEE